jgi:hypothetical protein
MKSKFSVEWWHCLEMDGGDGCTTMWMYLMPFNLKKVKMVKFILHKEYKE